MVFIFYENKETPVTKLRLSGSLQMIRDEIEKARLLSGSLQIKVVLQ
jgi:hypothetical protein